jgi:hypothetical protein
MNSDDVLARAEAALQRHGGQSRLQKRALKRVVRAGAIKAKRVAWLMAAFLLCVPLWALLVQPIGVVGLMLAVIAFLGLALALVLIPVKSIATHDFMPQTELARLPLSTETWLASQRPALPPPAQRLADGIGLKLEQLSPQLEHLNEQEPAAATIRRLIAEELPELVNGYQRVPQHLRMHDLNGLTPDKQLVDGLLVVDSELKRMSEQIARGDLTQLATQTRYLEIKYQGDGS